MGVGDQILFFLSGLGVFNGILLAIYFIFFVKEKKWINLLFGLLMLMLCIRIGKSLFHVFTDLDRIYRQIGLSACFMIGPFLYLYVREFLAEARRPNLTAYLHISMPLAIIIVIGYIWPYETNYAVWNEGFVYWIYLVWILYLVRLLDPMVPLFIIMLQKKSSIKSNWLLLVYGCVLLLCLAYNLALFNFPYLGGPILFSLVLYVMMGFLVRKKNRDAVVEETPLKYKNNKVDSTKANELIEQLQQKMQAEQIYLNPKIKLAEIAQSVNSSPHEISQVINETLGVSFNQYINQFRVNAACSLLKQTNNLTLEGVGKEVGFHSRSAFYSAFKSQMQQTPGQYKSNIEQTNE